MPTAQEQNLSTFSLPITAAGALTGKRFVTHAKQQAGAEANTLGVVRADAESGDVAVIDVFGTAQVEAGGPISEGAEVETDSEGRAVAQVLGPVVGWSMGTAQQAGDVIEVLIRPS